MSTHRRRHLKFAYSRFVRYHPEEKEDCIPGKGRCINKDKSFGRAQVLSGHIGSMFLRFKVFKILIPVCGT